MPLINLIVIAAILSVALFLVNRYIPIEPLRTILLVLIVVIIIVWLLSLAGMANYTLPMGHR